MRLMGLRAAKQDLSGAVKTAQREGIVITNHGRPSAVILGVEGYDLEDVVRMASREFWTMIQDRRKEEGRGHSSNAVRKLLGLKNKLRRTRK